MCHWTYIWANFKYWTYISYNHVFWLNFLPLIQGLVLGRFRGHLVFLFPAFHILCAAFLSVQLPLEPLTASFQRCSFPPVCDHSLSLYSASNFSLPVVLFCFPNLPSSAFFFSNASHLPISAAKVFCSSDFWSGAASSLSQFYVLPWSVKVQSLL